MLSLNPSPWADAVERLHARLFEIGGRDLTERTVMIVPPYATPHIDGPFVDRINDTISGNRVVIPCPFGDAVVIGADPGSRPDRVLAFFENADISHETPFWSEVYA